VAATSGARLLSSGRPARWHRPPWPDWACQRKGIAAKLRSGPAKALRHQSRIWRLGGEPKGCGLAANSVRSARAWT